MPDENDATAFLRALLQGVPLDAGRYFYLWELATKRTFSFACDGDGIAASTCWELPPSDLYVGVAMADGPVPERQRLKNDTAAGIFGVYLDIDIAGVAHQKPNLPPTLEVGKDLLDEFGPPPTVLLNSGHGLQPWWLLHEAWLFRDDDDRRSAAALTKGWVDAHRSVAQRHGWDHDAVGDLARVLRLPGTVNTKIPDHPVDVDLITAAGPRYTVHDLHELLERHGERPRRALLALPPATPPEVEDVPFEINADAQPPERKLGLLLQHPGAAASWAHDRPDFHDQSPSTYDQSLASIAVRQGWDDQEVVNLLIASRRRNNCPLKLRPDYFQRTLERARQSVEGEGTDGDDDPSFEAQIKSRGLIPVLAEVLEDTEHFANDRSGDLFRYSGGRYIPATGWAAHEVRAILEAEGATKNWRETAPRQLANYISVFAPALWSRPPSQTINVENGLVDVDTSTLRPHEPGYLTPVQLPIQFDPKARCPAIDQFVREVFPEDAFDLAFEVLALAMVPDSNIQKVVLFLGQGGNGKSVFLRLVQRFIGPENYATLPLQRLEDDRFSASRLDGKLANICADLPATDLQGTSMLKGITGGDRLTVERKYHDSYDLHPYCKLIFSANEAPRTPDASEGFFQRWIVVPFDRTFRDQAAEVGSRELDARLQTTEELSGALNRALEARRRISVDGLSEPLSCLAAREQFRATTDPVSVWIDQSTVSAPGGHVAKGRLLEEFNAHAIGEGRPTMTAQKFGRALRRTRPDLQQGQRILAGRKTDVWLDIVLRQDAKSVESGDYGEFPIGGLR